jgi:hypothetical protein
MTPREKKVTDSDSLFLAVLRVNFNNIVDGKSDSPLGCETDSFATHNIKVFQDLFPAIVAILKEAIDQGSAF